jgi:hypothetical protein
MGSTKSRAGVLVGLGAAAGVFGVAALMSAATAPAARADDFTDVVNTIEGVVAGAQADFSQAATDFGGSNVTGGLTLLLDGTDSYLVGVPDDLLVGAVDVVTNDPVQLPIDYFALTPPTDFSDALSDAQTDFTGGLTELSNGAEDFFGGDFGYGAYVETYGSVFAFVIPADELLIGAVEALGF